MGVRTTMKVVKQELGPASPHVMFVEMEGRTEIYPGVFYETRATVTVHADLAREYAVGQEVALSLDPQIGGMKR